MQEEKGVLFGIDISHYQTVDWDVFTKQKKHPIQFVVVRATMGKRIDTKFKEYFSAAKEHGFLVGAYHYYDPNENSKVQAENYIKKVSSVLKPGDIIPILDIEKLSKVQNNEKLIQGLKNWSRLVEEKFGVKPMIYTSLKFWDDFLQKDFSEHTLWLASYSSHRRIETRELCQIHQFTEEVKIPGIKEPVDGNDIKVEDLDLVVMN